MNDLSIDDRLQSHMDEDDKYTVKVGYTSLYLNLDLFNHLGNLNLGPISGEDIGLLGSERTWNFFGMGSRIVYNKQIFDKVASRLINATGFDMSFKKLPISLIMELKIVFHKMNFFLDYNRKKKIDVLIDPKEQLINHLLNPSYAKDLEKKIDLSIKKAISVDYLINYLDDDLFEMKAISQIFPPSHLLPYEYEEPIEDVLLTLNESKINPKKLKKLEEEMAMYIDDQFIYREFDIYDENDCRNIKLVDTDDHKTVSSISLKREGFKFEDDELNFLIKKIQKNPVEKREIAIPTMKTKRECLYFRNLSKLANKHPLDYYTKSVPKNQKRELIEDGSVYILFDLKKFGWLFPRQLVDSYFKVLLTKLEGKPREKVESFYSKFKKTNLQIFEGDKIKLGEGWVLGQFDNIGSFIMSSLLSLFLRKNKEFEPLVKNARFKGDDSYIKLKSTSKESIIFWREWFKFLSSTYGITLKKEKCILSNSGIFCEIFGYNSQIDTSKDINYALVFFDSLRCINITQAKEFINMFNIGINSEGMANYVTTLNSDGTAREAITYLMNTIGYEFSIDEYAVPFECGGWLSYFEEGLNSVFRKVDKGEVNSQFMNVGLIQKLNTKISINFKKKNRMKDVFKDAFRENDIDPFLQIVRSGFTKKYEGNPFSKKNTNLEKVWEEYRIKRVKAFKEGKTVSNQMFITEKIKHRNLRNYWIPLWMFKRTNTPLLQDYKVDDVKLPPDFNKKFRIDQYRAITYDYGYSTYFKKIPLEIIEKSKLNIVASNGYRAMSKDAFDLCFFYNMSYKAAISNLKQHNGAFMLKLVTNEEIKEGNLLDYYNENIDPNSDVVYFNPLYLRYMGTSSFNMQVGKDGKPTQWIDWERDCERINYNAFRMALDNGLVQRLRWDGKKETRPENDIVIIEQEDDGSWFDFLEGRKKEDNVVPVMEDIKESKHICFALESYFSTSDMEREGHSFEYWQKNHKFMAEICDRDIPHQTLFFDVTKDCYHADYGEEWEEGKDWQRPIDTSTGFKVSWKLYYEAYPYVMLDNWRTVDFRNRDLDSEDDNKRRGLVSSRHRNELHNLIYGNDYGQNSVKDFEEKEAKTNSKVEYFKNLLDGYSSEEIPKEGSLTDSSEDSDHPDEGEDDYVSQFAFLESDNG